VILIPIGVPGERYVLLVVLQDDNLERMRQHDPCDVRMHNLGPTWLNTKLEEVVVAYANAEESAEAEAMARRGASPIDFLRYFMRGYNFSPEKGDGGQVQEIGPE
jgi:hypothetical protein